MAWRSLLLVVGQEGQDGQEEWLIVWTRAWDASWDTGNKESWSWRDMVLGQQAGSTEKIAGGGGSVVGKRCGVLYGGVLPKKNNSRPQNTTTTKARWEQARLITGNRERMQFSVVFLKYD